MWLLILFWLLFGISHSLLAATKVRAFFETFTPNKPHYFRLLYNLVALVLLYGIGFETFPYLYEHTPDYVVLNLVSGLTACVSFLVLLDVVRQMDLKAFLGFKSEENNGQLMTRGWYKIVRHPLYFGLLLLGLAIFLNHSTPRTLVSLLFSQLYVVIGIEFEERKLRRVFGQAYLDYAKGKKKFIPFIY
jgi:methanethiol S-methyltransferase